ncbi:8560_t:CDS:1 [Scutellospora calospora]|uniref:8560_t:CDS:1 n=1 Tax=Scutellospora calospora TaxID=85575 RepID=A0ACA9LF79_9GLOM|nr:8560_t:CDS:1 [Scutellospora calospora]
MSATLQRQTFKIPTSEHKGCSRKRFYFETDEPSYNVNKRVKTPHLVNSVHSSTLPFSTFRYHGSDKKLVSLFASNNIDLKENQVDVESESYSETSRIIDLSTGESLKPISNVEQERQKLKRPIEFVENDNEDFSSTECLNIDEVNTNFYKKIKTSETPTENYIEDIEEDNPKLIEHTVDTVQEFKNCVTTRPSTFNISNTSMIIKGKNSTKIEFTAQYQEAFNKYMRSQLENVKNDDQNVYGKEMILYRQNNDGYIVKDDDNGNSDDYTIDSKGKIFEIEDDNDIQMFDTDETNTNYPDVDLSFDEGGQSLDEDDKMDIDE